MYSTAPDDVISNLKFKQLSIFNSLPTDEVQKVYQAKDGFMWFATRYGFCQYDGYRTTLYKSNLYSPDLLTNNNVYCLADDNDSNLWIGTQGGLNVLNKKTGEIRKYLSPTIPNNTVSCLLITQNSSVWIGTDTGLCRYIPEQDSFVTYTIETTGGILGSYAIKSLFEDTTGDIWIGTWCNGLYRYASATKTFVAYPQINERNSAHAIYEDSQKNIWVGSWECGLFLLQNPKDMKRVSYIRYQHKIGDEHSLSDNIIYDIAEDLNTHTLWVGTRTELSIMQHEQPGHFINYKSRKSAYHIPCDEINSIIRDDFGNMWIGSIGGGVLMTDTHESPFMLHKLNLSDEEIPSTSVRALFADANKNIWMGIGTYGLACQNHATGQLMLHT
ncbi:ligand-binding sensor domain-containing protein, partial [Bacteroides reticulotermitis]